MATRTISLSIALLASCLMVSVASAWNPDGNQVSHTPGHAYEITAVPNASGGLFVAWSNYLWAETRVTSHVYIQSLAANGEVSAGWTAGGILLSSEVGEQRTVTLAADGSGGAYVSWLDFDVLGSTLVLQRITADGAVAPGWPAAGLGLAGGIQSPALLSPDGAGGIFVGWSVVDHAAYQVTRRLLRLEPDGSFAAGWPAEGIPIGPIEVPTASFAIAHDGAGRVLVAWSEFQPPPAVSKLVVQRFTRDGLFDPSWPAGGTVLTSDDIGFIDPALLPDAGGTFVAWSYRPVLCPLMNAPTCPTCYCNSERYALRLDAQGGRTPGWPMKGLAIGDFGRVAPDGAGGLLAASFRPTGPGPHEIWFPSPVVSRYGANGAPALGWPANGRSVSSEARRPVDVAAASDGVGGAFATWIDYRTYEPVLYGTRFTASGSIAPGWPEFGSLIAPAGRYGGGSIVLAPMGADRAIVLWLDSRTGDRQIFADEVVAGPPGQAAPLDVVPDGSAGFGITRVWPNPSRSGFSVTLELPDESPATLDIVDVTGRVVGTERFDFAGPARGSVRLGRDRPLEPGIYWVRLRQGPRSATQRVIAIR